MPKVEKISKGDLRNLEQKIDERRKFLVENRKDIGDTVKMDVESRIAVLAKKLSKKRSDFNK